MRILGPRLAGSLLMLFRFGCFSLFDHPSISAEHGCAWDGVSARGTSALAQASRYVCNT